MLTVHHLGISQSERIVWLCEELGIPYALKRYTRNASDRLAPPDYKALHPVGAAPVITDGDLVLAESAAIIEYIIARYGNGRLALKPDHPNYTDYLYWFHFANGSLQPSMGRNMILRRLNLPDDNPMLNSMKERLDLLLGSIEKRLGEVDYFAGEFSAADVIMVFSLTTMRHFLPFDLTPYPNILAYLQRTAKRPAYQAAMQKGDPELVPLLS